MRLLLWTAAPAALLIGFAACGGSVETPSTGGAGGQTSSTTQGTGAETSTAVTTAVSSSSSGGGAGGASHGDCQTDADCDGHPCVPLTPGGYKVCLTFPMEATMCSMSGDPGCCTSADCPPGSACYAGASLLYCGGAFPAFNTCVGDECQTDADCPPGNWPLICAPAGALNRPKRFCLTAYCRTDADCTAKPGGACLLIGQNPCCNNPAPDGLGCVYPGDCHTDADCPKGACHLVASKGVSACGDSGPGCPP